jgi:hypothetical protein
MTVATLGRFQSAPTEAFDWVGVGELVRVGPRRHREQIRMTSGGPDVGKRSAPGRWPAKVPN